MMKTQTIKGKYVLPLLDVCKETLYRYRKQGLLTPIRFNSRNFRYKTSDVADLLGITVSEVEAELESIRAAANSEKGTA